MPKGDTWPGGVAMESFSQLDSAGSYDSVISMNSECCSEDSMEHLTAEERACIMYLEEMIEALEVQEDSGLSNDEPDPGILADDVSSFKPDEKSEPGYKALTTEYKAEHSFLNETSAPRVPAANTKDVETSVTLSSQHKPPVTEPAPDSKMQPPASELSVFTDGDGHLKIVPSASLCPSPSTETASEMDVCVIPPPSDFSDEPGLTVKVPPPPAGTCSDKSGETVDLEQLRQRASVRKTPVTQEPPSKPPELSPPPLSPEAAELRSPPAVAPKPKKLPANIFLKPHKAAVSPNGSPGYLAPTGGDRLLLDPQRVHMEALRKLGLLPAEADSSPSWSPDGSPRTRKSWTAPVSPGTPRSAPLKPSFNRINSSPASCITPHSPVAMSPLATIPAVQCDPILPAPAAFSDPEGPEVQVNTPPGTPPVLVKHLSLPKVVRSATLERSGLGLSSYADYQDSNQGTHKRKNRARPASLGSGKEFTSAVGEKSQVGHNTSKEPDLRRSLPAFQILGDSPKMPRSQGISVLICPRAESREDRHNALKKLGLLRD